MYPLVNRRIDHDAFHVRLSCEMLEHRRPNPPFRPTIKPFVDSVPLTVFLWEESPLRSTAGHPEHTGDEVLAGQWFANVEV